MDNISKGPELKDIPICRFRFPKFPLDKTKLVFGIPKDTDEDKIKRQKDDLNKVVKYLIRQTYAERNVKDSENWRQFKKLSFWEFLYEAGMFSTDKKFQECTEDDRKNAWL